MAFQSNSFQVDAFQAGAGGLVLVVPRYDNTNEFFAHTVVPGTVTLTATRLDNTNTFFGHTVVPGTVVLTVSRFDNVNEFFSHTVVPSGSTLEPPLLTNTSTIYVPDVVQVIRFPDWVEPGWVEPGWVEWPYFNRNQFFPATIGLEIQPPLLVNNNTFYVATVGPSYTITPTQAALLYRIALLHGLVPGNPLEVTKTSRVAGSLVQAISESGNTVTLSTTSVPLVIDDPAQWIEALAALHGLTTDLIVTPTSRVAGAINQSMAESAGLTTVTRL